MDLSNASKKQLKAVAEHLEIEVEAKKKNKPTNDELVAALEAYEEENPGLIDAAAEKLGFEEDEVEETDEDETEDEVEVAEEAAPAKKGKGQVYTYVGKGETSPQRIKFMGKQDFVRGRPVEVTDPALIAKIEGNPTFIKGKADPELLQEIEDEGIAVAENNRAVDARMDANFKKQHGGAGKGE